MNRQNWKPPTVHICSLVRSNHLVPGMFTFPQGLVKDKFAMPSNLIEGAIPTIFSSKLKTLSSTEEIVGPIATGTASESTPLAPPSSRLRQVLLREVGCWFAHLFIYLMCVCVSVCVGMFKIYLRHGLVYNWHRPSPHEHPPSPLPTPARSDTVVKPSTRKPCPFTSCQNVAIFSSIDS